MGAGSGSGCGSGASASSCRFCHRKAPTTPCGAHCAQRANVCPGQCPAHMGGSARGFASLPDPRRSLIVAVADDWRHHSGSSTTVNARRTSGVPTVSRWKILPWAGNCCVDSSCTWMLLLCNWRIPDRLAHYIVLRRTVRSSLCRHAKYDHRTTHRTDCRYQPGDRARATFTSAAAAWYALPSSALWTRPSMPGENLRRGIIGTDCQALQPL